MTDANIKKELSLLTNIYNATQGMLSQYIVGNDDLIELLVIGIFSGGHVLIEGIPGTAKTTIAKAMARITGCEFRRVQCAVDTQPADIIGVRVYDQDSKEFQLEKARSLQTSSSSTRLTVSTQRPRAPSSR